MNKLSIRLANVNDIAFWMNMIEAAGWDNTVADAKRCLYLEPKGCFIASSNKDDIGIVNSFQYGKLGWIGNLIVKPEFRGLGYGEELMKYAINHLKNEGVTTIRLDAVPKAVSLYERLGFKHEWKSLRYSCISEKKNTENVTLIKPSEMNEIHRLDKRYCGFDRKKFVEKIREEFPNLCYKISLQGKIRGYIMARHLNNSYKIGPWICEEDNEYDAEQLLHTVMRQTEGFELKLGIPEPNLMAIKIAEKNQFNQLPTSFRMCLGDRKKLGIIKGVYGIGSPDKG
ncbi:GNAT family N-acetyltransferase [Candidatus Bathyarchaeota archaeon]|nr:GNAT family N-acetyltransferase [Candidatus Bathyarchaeota archaeon]